MCQPLFKNVGLTINLVAQTVGTINGQTIGLNSFTFFGNQAPASQAIQTILRTGGQ